MSICLSKIIFLFILLVYALYVYLYHLLADNHVCSQGMGCFSGQKAFRGSNFQHIFYNYIFTG